MAATYLDSSAIVKLVVREDESVALRRYLRRRRPLVSSSLARTEVMRALLPGGDEAVGRSRPVQLGTGHLAAETARISTSFEGTSEIQRMIIGRAVTGLDVR